MSLVINQRIVDDIVIFDMLGKLWVLDLPLSAKVQGMLSEGRRFFILNIENVDYIDSSGLGQMVSLWTSVRTKKGNLVLLRPSKRVQRLLTVSRLQVVFDIFEDEERAVLAVHRDW